MIQDIAPHKYHVEYTPCTPTSEDILFIFRGSDILVHEENGRTWFPAVGGFDIKSRPVFLFRIDDTNIFMTDVDEGVCFEGWNFVKPEYFRTAAPHWKAFAGITAVQLHRWYAENKFCSRCGAKTKRGTRERCVICTECGKTVYPRISPCVIVALTNGDRIMLTKYNKSHSPYRRDPGGHRAPRGNGGSRAEGQKHKIFQKPAVVVQRHIAGGLFLRAGR